MRALLASQTAPFVVPLGIGEHLRKWGVPGRPHRRAGLGRRAPIGGLTLTCTEARHFSGRYLYRDTTLWASWAVAGPRHRVFFGGDTGYTPAFAEIGARLGPFDLTLLPVGAYNDAWHAIHMDPEEAMRAHGDLGGRGAAADPLGHVQPGLPPLGRAGQRLVAAAERMGAQVVVPVPGQRIDVLDPRSSKTGGRRSARPSAAPASTPPSRVARSWSGRRPPCSASAAQPPCPEGRATHHGWMTGA